MLAWALRAFGRAPGKAPAYAAIALLACANVAYVARTNGGRPGKGGDDAMVDAARAQRRAAMRAALSTSARAGDGERERGGGHGAASAGGERGGERGGGGGGWWFK